ncbi:MAG: hypothetical protein HON48_13510, partial [Desulfobacula sp.]|nr:hypothetical protein [Desulfobacula sp.]
NKTWYKIRPVDTFFFKGSTPMVMGENHTSEFIFPPPAGAIAGAVRTAVLRQQDIDFKTYTSKTYDNAEIISALGKACDPPPFEILGPILSKAGNIYLPAPFSWYMEKNDTSKEAAIPVYRGKPIESSFIKTSKGKSFYIARGRDGELLSMGGRWIKLNDFYSNGESIRVRPLADFFVGEPRTGIALENNRKVRESHLYTFNHIRFKKDVELVFGISHKGQLPFSPNGILQLGAEKRLGCYETIEIDIYENQEGAGSYMSLSSLVCKDIDETSLIATGKIQYIGGWDMKKGFHKPSCEFYPAGSVFTKNLNDNQIPIKGE